VSAVAETRIDRPRPPDYLVDAAIDAEFGGSFIPAPDVSDWIVAAFLDKGAPFYNADHQHLRHANIGVLWTNVDNIKQMRSVVGMAEMLVNRGSKWQKARADLQLVQWFRQIPEFVITLSAPYCAIADDASFCALVDHELTHCAQDIDHFGAPKFHRQSGLPVFAIRDHDVTEFVSVVRRWGVRAAGPNVEAMVKAALQEPEFSGARIAATCGTCGAATAV
jgi:hypothetical protein